MPCGRRFDWRNPSPRALEDAAALAQISPTAEAEPLYRRAAESSDPSIAGPSLSALGGMRKAAGDRAGAAALYRRAVTKAEAIEGRERRPQWRCYSCSLRP